MSYYTASFTTTAQSAYTALCLVDRIARRHTRYTKRFCWSVYNTLTSDEAIALYQYIWAWCQVAYLVVVALATMAQEQVDIFVEGCQSVEEVAAYVEPLTGQSCPIEIPDVSVELPEVVEVAAMITIDGNCDNLVEPIYSNMSAVELRKECQSYGIKWRNAHGKGKHLLKEEMVALLSA